MDDVQITFQSVKIGNLFADKDGIVYMKLPELKSLITDESYNAVDVNSTVLEDAMKRVSPTELVTASQ